MKALLLTLLAVLLVPLVSAATLHGTIYTAELEVASDVVVEIDTTPMQRMLSTDGSYSFAVPPGAYTITLTYPEYGLNTSTTEQVLVEQDGDFTFDLFLLPSLDDDDLLDDLDSVLGEDTTLLEKEEGSFPWPALLLLGLLVFATALAIIMPRMHHKTGESGNGEEDMAAQVLRIMKEEGGRITQKELRKHLPHSEAKVSLVISELEAKGTIEKLKKGRGNILVMK